MAKKAAEVSTDPAVLIQALIEKTAPENLQDCVILVADLQGALRQLVASSAEALAANTADRAELVAELDRSREQVSHIQEKLLSEMEAVNAARAQVVSLEAEIAQLREAALVPSPQVHVVAEVEGGHHSVARPVRHNGRTYRRGERILLNAEDATRLHASGVIHVEDND